MLRRMSASVRALSFWMSSPRSALVEVALSSRSRPLATPVENAASTGALACGSAAGVSASAPSAIPLAGLRSAAAALAAVKAEQTIAIDATVDILKDFFIVTSTS